MKPSIQTLDKILYAPSQYVIPVFQRNYRWEQREWDKLWEDLMEIQNPEKKGNHFMGFLVFVPGLAQPGENTRFHLVDGQQRLATCSILLAAIRNAARNAKQARLAKEIHDYYLVHPNKKGEQHYRLLPKESDHDSYLALIRGKGEPTGRMADALAYFEGKLSETADGAPERLLGVFHTVCQRFEFMCATLETENAYNIFKSLNSTGVPLGPSDLIRNFVFMHIPPEEHDEFDRELWRPLENRFTDATGTLDDERFSRFFRDYLMSKPDGGYVRPAQTFAKFESTYEATDFSANELAQALTKSAGYYTIIAGQVPDKHTGVTRALADLNELESMTTYPLLLALLERRAKEAVSDEELVDAISMLRGFILRRFICGESSRGYGRIFVRAVSMLGSNPYANLERYLLGRGWPDDTRFIAQFVEFPLYQRGYAREVLVALERNRKHKEPAGLTEAQIEHIMPQTLSAAWRAALGPEADAIQAEWLHRPGNLTLSAYNLELWNHPFEKKQQRYAESNIVLTRELKGYELWTEANIRTRGEQLAAEAATIWIGPKIPVAVGPSADTSEDSGELTPTQRLRRSFWTGFVSEYAERNPDTQLRKPGKDAWMSFGIGVRYVSVETFVSVMHRRVGVGVMIVGPAKSTIFEQLHAQKQSIEAELGEALTWHELPNKKSSYVSMYLASDPNDPALWPEQQKWLVEMLIAFQTCFVPRAKAIVAAVGSLE